MWQLITFKEKLNGSNKKDKGDKSDKNPDASCIKAFMEFEIFSVSISNNNSKNNEKNYSENDLTFTEHIPIFMQN